MATFESLSTAGLYRCVQEQAISLGSACSFENILNHSVLLSPSVGNLQ